MAGGQGSRADRPPEGLYRSKPRLQAWLNPLASGVARRGVSADALSLAAVILAAVGGGALALGAREPAALLLVPVVAALRLVLNILDGMVARAAASGPHVLGEVWNEVADRAADGLFLVGLAAVPAVGPWLGLGGLLTAMAASYVGLASKAAGGRRLYGGIMSKPGRMLVLAVAAPVAFVTGDLSWLAAAGWLILVGSVVTIGQRLRTAISELDGAG